MRVACSKCQKMVDLIEVHRDDDAHRTKIVVHCHGDTDSMEVTDEWVNSDPEFAALIDSGLCLGWAFKDPERSDIDKQEKEREQE